MQNAVGVAAEGDSPSPQATQTEGIAAAQAGVEGVQGTAGGQCKEGAIQQQLKPAEYEALQQVREENRVLTMQLELVNEERREADLTLQGISSCAEQALQAIAAVGGQQ